MNFSSRQEKIIAIVKKFQPITGEEIASKLNLSRATLRPDFSLLTMADVLHAKPKVGYYYNSQRKEPIYFEKLLKMEVREVMSLPILVDEETSIYDAIVSLFLEDVGTLFVTNKGYLTGVVSRKDLLRSLLGGQTQKTPVGVLMTREPKLVKINQEESVYEALKRIVNHDVDALPVIVEEDQGEKVVGRFTKTNVAKLFMELINEAKEDK